MASLDKKLAQKPKKGKKSKKGEKNESKNRQKRERDKRQKTNSRGRGFLRDKDANRRSK